MQRAKHIGTYVVITASIDHHDYVRRLGAAVFDTVGSDITVCSFAVFKSGGRLATIAAGTEPPIAPRQDVENLRPHADRDRKHLNRIIALFEGGAIVLPEITCYPLPRAADAQQVSESRHLRGKSVLEVR